MEKAVEASRKLAANFDWPLWVSRWNSPELENNNLPKEKRGNLRRPQAATLTTGKGSAHQKKIKLTQSDKNRKRNHRPQ